MNRLQLTAPLLLGFSTRFEMFLVRVPWAAAHTAAFTGVGCSRSRKWRCPAAAVAVTVQGLFRINGLPPVVLHAADDVLHDILWTVDHSEYIDVFAIDIFGNQLLAHPAHQPAPIFRAIQNDGERLDFVEFAPG